MWCQLLWRDVSEIFFFASVFYYSGSFLKKDSQHNLLGYAIAYALFAGLCYALALHSITSFLWWFSPTITILFITFHQETLQKNFICLVSAQPSKTPLNNDWLETLLSTCLLNVHQTRATSCIIEHRHQLQDLLETPFILNTPVVPELLTMLCTSESYDQDKSLWITSQGLMRGINTTWRHTKQYSLYTSAAHLHAGIAIDQALIVTSKTDALIFYLDPATRLFTLIIHDTVFKHIQAGHAKQLIKKHITYSGTTQEILHAKNSKHSTQQHSS